MPRPPRLVIPGQPHHVTQRGQSRHPVFFSEEDYAFYLALLRHWCVKTGVAVWA